MGVSKDYPNVPEWVSKSEGYKTGAMVKYKGNIFYASFWASEPGVGDADYNGWRFYDELYDLTPHTPTEQAKIIAYIPTWRKKEGFNYANEEMYQYITHGIIAFLMFSETNLGEFDPISVDNVNAMLSDVVNTGHQKGTRILIALGGATDYGFLNLMTSVGNNSANPLLDQAVQNVVNFVNSNDLDGVDLDLECWWDKNSDASKDQGGRPRSEGPHPAGYALTLFAQKLKQAMPDKLVSAAVFGTSWYGNNYDSKIADHVDWIAIMTYDLTGSWNASPVGPHSAHLKIRNQDSAKIRNQEFYQESYTKEQQGEWPGGGTVNNPILSVEDTLWYWTNPLFVNWGGSGQNIPRNKIAAGVPIYGYDFAYGKDPDDLSGQIPPGYKLIQYKNILAQFPDAPTAANGNIKVPGNTPSPPFIPAPGTYPYAHNIYFETPKTATDKLNFLKSVGAQGVIIWELSNDVWQEGKSIVKALYQNSGNPAIRPALPSKIKLKSEPEPGLTFPREWIGVFAEKWSESVQVFSSKSVEARATEEPNDNLNIGISGSPAVAVFNNKLYCVYEGSNNDGSLHYCTFDGQNWSGDKELNNRTSGPPALAVFNNKLYCVHEGSKENGWLSYCSTSDGQNWSSDEGLGDHGTSLRARRYPTATLAVYKGLLYCVHEGQGDKDGKGWLWYSTFDGQNWSKDKKLPNHGTTGAGALAVVDGKLICMHEGKDGSGLMWYTSFEDFLDTNEWNEDRQVVLLDNEDKEVECNTSGPPAVVTDGNKLYCVHEGSKNDGRVWSFNNKNRQDEILTIGEPASQRLIGTSGSPAIAIYNNKFYILHQGPGNDGQLWMETTTLQPISSNWIELQGDNSYCYCACSSDANNKQKHDSNKAMNVKEGAPYLYAVLTKDDDTVDFPTGAVMTIEGPDGTKYDRDIQEENQLVIMSGSSVRCLIVKDPKPGDWKMTMTIPEGVGFHCECNTVPSKDVYDTITETLDNSLQKRGIVSGALGWRVLAALGVVLAPEIELAVIGITFMVTAVGVGRRVQSGKFGDTQLAQLGKSEIKSANRIYKNSGKEKTAKWMKNTASTTSKKKKKEVGRHVYAVAHNGRGDFIIGFKNQYGLFFHTDGGVVKQPPGQSLNGGNDYALPGGELNEGENPIIGASIEFYEETNELLSGWRWEAQPEWYEGQQPPNSPTPTDEYYGVYFDVGDQLLQLVQTISINLVAGGRAAQAVIQGQYQEDYNGLRADFPGCPEDNELNRVYLWSFQQDWQTIQGWRNDRRKSWYYYILDNLRDQLGITG